MPGGLISIREEAPHPEELAPYSLFKAFRYIGNYAYTQITPHRAGGSWTDGLR